MAADEAENVRLLEEVAAEFGVTLDVLVEVKVMPLRCGVDPGEAVVRLARRIADRPPARAAGQGRPRLRHHHAVVDGGTKAMTTETWVHGREEVSGAGLRRGEKLLLIPPHCDPTVDLHDRYVGVRCNRVEALRPITARGAIR